MTRSLVCKTQKCSWSISVVIRRRGNDPLLSRRRRSRRRSPVGCLYWQPCTNGASAHRHALDVNPCAVIVLKAQSANSQEVRLNRMCMFFAWGIVVLSLLFFLRLAWLETCSNLQGFWRGHPCGASNYYCVNWRWVQHAFCVQSSHIFGITTLLSSQLIWWANFVAPVLYSLKPHPSTQFPSGSKRRSGIQLFVLAILCPLMGRNA